MLSIQPPFLIHMRATGVLTCLYELLTTTNDLSQHVWQRPITSAVLTASMSLQAPVCLANVAVSNRRDPSHTCTRRGACFRRGCWGMNSTQQCRFHKIIMRVKVVEEKSLDEVWRSDSNLCGSCKLKARFTHLIWMQHSFTSVQPLLRLLERDCMFV